MLLFNNCLKANGEVLKVGSACIESKPESIIAYACLTERHTRRTETKVGYSDPMVSYFWQEP